MAGTRQRFGLLFYGTLAIAAIECAGLGFSRVWPTVKEQWTIRRAVQQLRDRSPTVRDRASARLRRIGPHAAPAVLRALGDPDAQVRRECCSILRVICHPPGPIPSELIEALEDGDVEVFRLCGWILGQFATMDTDAGHAATWKKAIQPLRRRLDDPAPAIRATAAEILGGLGTWAKPSVADLERATYDGEPQVRLAAASALARIRPHNRRAIAALGELLADPRVTMGKDLFARSSLKWNAAELLKAKAGQSALAAATQRALEHPARSVRLDMLMIMADQGGFPRSVLERTRALLDDPDVRVRGQAALVLLGEGSQQADEATTAALAASVDQPADSDEDLYLLNRASGGLQRAVAGSEPRVVTTLLKSLERLKGPQARTTIAERLGNLGPAAFPAIPILTRFTRDPDPTLSSVARAALMRIAPGSYEGSGP